MTSRTAWVIVIFGLLSAFALMLGLVLGSGIASTVIAALGTIGALAGLVTQLMPSTGEKPAAHADSKPATTRPPAGTGLGRRPWLVLVTGLGVVAALGGALVLVRPNGRAASGGGTLRVSLDTSQPPSVSGGPMGHPWLPPPVSGRRSTWDWPATVSRSPFPPTAINTSSPSSPEPIRRGRRASQR